jgi:hypothetical protein
LDSFRDQPALAFVQAAVEASLDTQDPYVQKAMEANFENGYFQPIHGSSPPSPELSTFQTDGGSDAPIFTAIDPAALKKLLTEAESDEEQSLYDQRNKEVVPGVFISGSDITSLVHDFCLNAEQSFTFRIICNHAMGHYSPSDPPLLMGIFGEGGTGKSRLIDTIRAWFKVDMREREIIVAATTGTATVKIDGSTVYSAVSIPIDDDEGTRMGKLSPKQEEDWADYLLPPLTSVPPLMVL